MGIGDLQGGGGVGRFENPVALPLEILARQAAEIAFVFDEQDCFLAALEAGQAG